ncbi:MAG: hypothetical protein GWN01_09315 [Nitrosopumilaceae archaeon]|nr:hypothetical protein [Nitrosopumilaceae archaeon]NIU87808.1 hypothetical protein [Nitrosopumilaceae archaeon]NIV65190.1 hypothetical protein [Nitrosopumilaceae archaeon]NIX61706.1 hypothetical protein [Nitrosopumilaceae archaeon]
MTNKKFKKNSFKRKLTLSLSKADAILTGDWHLREDQPICRTDDYWVAQWQKVNFIRKLSEEHECPVIQPGDFFDHWKPSPRLLAYTFMHLPKELWVVYGNHDLPQHSLDLVEKSGLYALASGSNKVRILPGGHWGLKIDDASMISIRGRKLLVRHVPVYKGGTLPWPNSPAIPASKILDDYPEYDLIVTGDLHQCIVYEKDERLLVNAGSLMRMTVDQVNDSPCVFLWYAKTNTVKKIALPIVRNVVSREHLNRREEKENRYHAFIEGLRNDERPELSFRHNLDAHFKTNCTLSSIQELIYKYLD